MSEKIGIFGLGYVGNAVKTGFIGENKIWGYDPNKESCSKEEVVKNGEIIFVCVPTPRSNSGKADTSIVEQVCKEIDEISNESKIVVIKSTCTPGTTKKLDSKYPNHKFLFNPEFLDAATAQEDFLNPDRIVIGYPTDEKVKRVKKLYEGFDAPLLEMGSDEAEMVKYMTNSFYGLRVVFAVQMYDLCNKLDIDYETVREGFEEDRRVSPGHFNPTHSGYTGYGGGCIPKDVSAIVHHAKQNDVDLSLVDKAEDINLNLLKRNERGKKEYKMRYRGD